MDSDNDSDDDDNDDDDDDDSDDDRVGAGDVNEEKSGCGRSHVAVAQNMSTDSLPRASNEGEQIVHIGLNDTVIRLLLPLSLHVECNLLNN